MNHFKGKQFQKDVIIVAVGYYLRYNLSYRDVQEILYNRGINVSHTTVYRWVQEYGKLLYNIWKRKNKQSIYSWKMDETYIKIKGKGNDGLTARGKLCRWSHSGYMVTEKARYTSSLRLSQEIS